ncbi:MAG: formyl-CoA transferase [Rhodospirillales bacterium 69-11]|nr:CoA transferase [Rhodospirillales bacterium]MBN8929558.1 CoA transferase [Rhodospirillales bacterium]OJW25350.1 MAG: formyl-CoA transferase [Rhodospirillales bacterium 69-11]
MPDSPTDRAQLAATETRLPLNGITVLDLTLARAGPTAVRHFADWGADVIRIEPPATEGEDVAGRRTGFDFQNLHRNKRAITLNLKTPEGHAAFMRLAAKADVILENMRANVKHRLKVSYDDVRAVNPRIVYGSISGFGQDGPYGARAGVDQIAQGMGGLMSITGEPGRGPMRVGIPVDDLTAGNLLAMGCLMALFDRGRTGVGRWVTTSLLEAQIFMLDFQASRWLMEKEVAGQAGNDHPTGIPTGVFPTADGHINIAASSSRVFARFCEAIGRPDWLQKEEWKTQVGRSKDRKAINDAISEITRMKPSEHWIELFEGAGIPCGPINTIDQVFADPQVQHLKMATPMKSPYVGDTEVVASALNISGFSKAIRTYTPDAGEHTNDVLKSVGYTDEELQAMRTKGVI